jgi:hypothetical protein
MLRFGGNIFQNLNVSSPAPVTTLSPSEMQKIEEEKHEGNRTIAKRKREARKRKGKRKGKRYQAIRQDRALCLCVRVMWQLVALREMTTTQSDAK